MPTTPRLGIYYPVLADDPDVPDDMRRLAESIEDAAIGWSAGDFKFSFQTTDHDQFIKCDGNPRLRASLPTPYLALIDSVMGIHPDPARVYTPNFKRRSPMGADPGGATIAGVVPNLAALAGEERHTLTVAELAAHTHQISAPLQTPQPDEGYPNSRFLSGGALGDAPWHLGTESTGGNTPHNNISPVLFGHWFIATGGGGSGTGGGGGGGIDPPADVVLATANLAAGTGESGVITIGAGWRLLRIESDQLARIRFYSTPAKRDTDIPRPLATEPPDYPALGAAPNHGCMLEENLVAANLEGGVYVQDLAPNVIGSSGETPRSNDIAYRIDNTGVAAHVINLTFTVQALETA